jgi:hypothetical protein
MGYARQKEWGRRVVDFSLWSVVVLLSAYIGRLARRHDYGGAMMPVVCLYLAVLLRCEVWESEVLRAFGRPAASHVTGAAFILRMVGLATVVVVVAALAPR